ncbi:hypothetical protein NEF87_001563 [Candidatus Lokiarchaeum ossiferum]|uniref:Uncharacterized protein n=1 Tax=Candidatus Lokiarchaeum ossiferum TaxID=2951803 RepID=A0ABY6HP35_9ARCH|nr:hypothetical protein NEF87_001563 [Candidatus Lokiarchaeum sp. B-35]
MPLSEKWHLILFTLFFLKNLTLFSKIARNCKIIPTESQIFGRSEGKISKQNENNANASHTKKNGLFI